MIFVVMLEIFGKVICRDPSAFLPPPAEIGAIFHFTLEILKAILYNRP